MANPAVVADDVGEWVELINLDGAAVNLLGWTLRDLDSRNGTRVDGKRVTRKRLDPGDKIRFAKHEYQIEYSPTELGAQGPPPPDEESMAQILGRSLLDRAGLTRRSGPNDLD